MEIKNIIKKTAILFSVVKIMTKEKLDYNTLAWVETIVYQWVAWVGFGACALFALWAMAAENTWEFWSFMTVSLTFKFITIWNGKFIRPHAYRRAMGIRTVYGPF